MLALIRDIIIYYIYIFCIYIYTAPRFSTYNVAKCLCIICNLRTNVNL